jgi:transglutaminase-like putative cysteine protease
VTGVTYRVVHRTTYTYELEVEASHGRAHLLPRDEPGQRVHDSAVRVTPEPDETHHHRDYFGNRATYFRVSSPHDRLIVESTSTVTVDRGRDGAELGTDDPALLVELVLPSPLVPRLDAIASYAAPSFAPGRSPGEAARDLMHRIHADFTYQPGATTVTTDLRTVLASRTGVCQDFAHLLVAGLRSRGLPARYVSGYLETSPPPGHPRLSGADASHAWVSVHLDGQGWLDLDPTNDQPADDRYVVVARGRDYGDVPPLSGVIFTEGSSSTMTVSVDVGRVPAPPG